MNCLTKWIVLLIITEYTKHVGESILIIQDEPKLASDLQEDVCVISCVDTHTPVCSWYTTGSSIGS